MTSCELSAFYLTGKSCFPMFLFYLFTFYFLFPWISCWSSLSLSLYSFGNLVILITRHNSDVDLIVWSFSLLDHFKLPNSSITIEFKRCQTLPNIAQSNAMNYNRKSNKRWTSRHHISAQVTRDGYPWHRTVFSVSRLQTLLSSFV